jgi:hypothetical protein
MHGREFIHVELNEYMILVHPVPFSENTFETSPNSNQKSLWDSMISGFISSVCLSVFLSLWLYSPFSLDFVRFFSFLILHTVGRTPWTGDQPVARPLPTHRPTQT